MLYGPSAFVSQAETLTLALAGSFLISVCIGTILDVSQAISPNDELLILLQYFFFSYQVFETLGNPVVIQCLCFTPHTSSCDMRKPLSLEGWRSILSNSPISFLLWEKCSFSWCLSHMHTYRHILTNGLYPAVLLFPKATVMHFHFILIFLFVLPGLLWFMTTRRENEQWGQTKWILAVQTCRIELSSGFIAHWNICLHFSRQTKMLSGLLTLLRIDSDLHLYSYICTIRLADFER